MERNRITRFAYLALVLTSLTPTDAKSNANTSRRRQQVRPTASRQQTGYGMRGDRGKENIEDVIVTIVDHQSRQLGKGKGGGGSGGK